MALGGKDSRANLLVDSKMFPTLKSTNATALRAFIQTLHPLMQRPEQRAAINLKDCMAEPRIAIILVQILQHKQILQTFDIEVEYFWRDWEFFHKTIKRHLEEGHYKSTGVSDLAVIVKAELEKLQLWFRDPLDDKEMQENLNKWNRFFEWYQTISTSSLDQVPLKKA
jgi:hypothetical protein